MFHFFVVLSLFLVVAFAHLYIALFLLRIFSKPIYLPVFEHKAIKKQELLPKDLLLVQWFRQLHLQ